MNRRYQLFIPDKIFHMGSKPVGKSISSGHNFQNAPAHSDYRFGSQNRKSERHYKHDIIMTGRFPQMGNGRGDGT